MFDVCQELHNWYSKDGSDVPLTQDEHDALMKLGESLQERIEKLEADIESETKWAKTYCDAFAKVRDAASNYLNRKEEMMTLGGSSSLKYYRDALDNLERILKETDGT